MRETHVTPTGTDAFRSLVEGRITTEQYLRSVDERVEELREPPPPPPPRSTSEPA
jgi:hypothetical protein